MGWFDEQIKQRKISDQEVLEDAMKALSFAILGKRAGKASGAEAALGEILQYYKLKPADIPPHIGSLEEQLAYCLRPHGIMYRTIRLEKGWYQDAFGPILAFHKEDGQPAALLPAPFKGYFFTDSEKKQKVRIGSGRELLFEEDAVCF